MRIELLVFALLSYFTFNLNAEEALYGYLDQSRLYSDTVQSPIKILSTYEYKSFRLHQALTPVCAIKLISSKSFNLKINAFYVLRLGRIRRFKLKKGFGEFLSFGQDTIWVKPIDNQYFVVLGISEEETYENDNTQHSFASYMRNEESVKLFSAENHMKQDCLPVRLFPYLNLDSDESGR